MSKETPKDDPREKTDWGSKSQSHEPWKGVQEKDQYDPEVKKPDLERWNDSKTH